MRTFHGRLLANQIRFSTCIALAASMSACNRRELTSLQREFLDMPRDVAPLYVLGDVNEDGAVNAADRELIGQLVARGVDSSTVACFAAADLTLDGDVDSSDVAAFSALAPDSTEIDALPLYAQPYAPCNYARRFVAATVDWIEGEPVQVRLLQGQTTDRVQISVEAGALEAKPLANRRGWDLALAANLHPDSLVRVRFTIGTAPFTFALANFTGLRPERADANAEGWVEASWTDLDGDTLITARDDPNDVPPPTVWGEEIASLDQCPQKGDGCEALVIDFAKRTIIDVDADYTKEALESVGCNVVYAAPSFVTVPRPYFVVRRSIHGGATWIQIQPPQADVDEAKAKNRAAWQVVRTAVATHRLNVAAGKDLVLQLVNGHGSKTGGYGSWGPGFATGAGSLSRKAFHTGNYQAARGKACYAVAVDWSCSSGLTPKAVDDLNNTGVAAAPATPPPPNHGFHAAFFGDMAASASSASDACANGSILVLDIEFSGVIRRHGQNRDFDGLAAGGVRPWILDEATGRYSDRGYNRRFGTACVPASHEHVY